MHKYFYNGPVMIFGKCVSNCWSAETMAESEAKAKSNMIFQYKKATNRIASTKVTLPGKVVLVN